MRRLVLRARAADAEPDDSLVFVGNATVLLRCAGLTVMGSLLEFGARVGAPPMRRNVSGDTLVCRDLERGPRRCPNVDLALFHQGGTRGLGVRVTIMDARLGVRALQVIQPRLAVSIHLDDFDRFRSPLADFTQAVARARLTEQVRYLRRGDKARFGVRRVRRPGAGEPISPPPPPHQPAAP